MKCEVRVNGALKTLRLPQTLEELVVRETHQPEGVAVALNGRVVPRQDWKQQEVQDGDIIEVVRAVQGG